jgi:hypothetical protein
MTRRVVVQGTGNVGLPAIRTILAHPDLELSGVIVHSEAKEGRDAGDLVGAEPTGVRATRDAAAVLATQPDALVYAANQDFRPNEAHAEMLAALEAGISVVTPGLYGLLHPATADPALRERFEKACSVGGASFITSGIDPGFAMDLLPMVLSGVCAEIDEIRIVENFNYATYAVPESVRAIIGFGSGMDETPLMLLPGVPTATWGGSIRALAEALDVELDDIAEVIERHALERDVETAAGSFAAGTQGAFRFEVQGISGGRPVIVVEHVTRIVDDTAPQWPAADGMGFHQVRITGTPNLTMTLESTDASGDHVAGGNTTAAARLVSAIPWLCDAEPGLFSGADLPLLSGRGRVRL